MNIRDRLALEFEYAKEPLLGDAVTEIDRLTGLVQKLESERGKILELARYYVGPGGQVSARLVSEILDILGEQPTASKSCCPTCGSPRKPLNELRASDIPRGCDSDDHALELAPGGG